MGLFSSNETINDQYDKIVELKRELIVETLNCSALDHLGALDRIRYCQILFEWIFYTNDVDQNADSVRESIKAYARS